VRSRDGRARAGSSIHEILYRPLHRGEPVSNRTQKRNAWGQQHQSARPEHDWIRREAPALRIVPVELWDAAHRYLDDARAKHLRGTDGRLWGWPRSTDSKYLLPGFARCACRQRLEDRDATWLRVAVRAAEVCHPRVHHPGVSDRLFKRCEMNARIAGSVMRKGRLRLAIGLR